MSRRTPLLLALALIAVFVAGPNAANAQSWAYYMNSERQFSGLFPGEPTERAVDYTTESGAHIAAHEFSAQRGDGHYTITVVDFADHMADMENAVAHAAAKVRARGTPSYDEFAQLNGIPGHAISVTEPDGRQTIAQMYLFETRLYIAEGSEPPNVAPAALFTQSIDIHHADGSSVNLNPGGATTREEILENRAREAAGNEG
jgi:hypothetical protein